MSKKNTNFALFSNLKHLEIKKKNKINKQKLKKVSKRKTKK
jgi:hypothetical protein